MHQSLAGERVLTEIDFVRLNRLRREQIPPELADLLESAEVVPSREIAPDIVTMYSQITLEDLRSKERQKLTLCYPADAQPSQGFISVLSPVGIGLLGQQQGAVVRWHTPRGEECAAKIVELLFQPEASGDYTT